VSREWWMAVPDMLPKPPTPQPTVAPTPGPLVLAPESQDHRVQSGECMYKVFNVCDNATPLGVAAFKTRSSGNMKWLGDPIAPYNQGVQIQYFTFGRMEFHGQDVGEKVLLGLLGRELLDNPANAAIKDKYTAPQQPGHPELGVYDETNKLYIAPEFAKYYTDNDEFARFGYPISSVYEANGKKMQWFQRVRMEIPAAAGSPSTVALAPVGCEHLRIIDRVESPACP
jgi:hypothetical protein